MTVSCNLTLDTRAGSTLAEVRATGLRLKDISAPSCILVGEFLSLGALGSASGPRTAPSYPDGGGELAILEASQQRVPFEPGTLRMTFQRSICFLLLSELERVIGHKPKRVSSSPRGISALPGLCRNPE